MKSLIAGIMLAVLFGSAAKAQMGTVSGFVSDESDGRSIEGVHVVVTTDDGIVRGAVTDRDGLYHIGRVPPGTHVIEASFIGFDSHEAIVEMTEGRRLTHNISLTTVDLEAGEVVVQAERTHGAARITAGQQTIRPADIELIPAPDVSADLAMYLTTLPGIVSVGDRGGQMFIRGGEPSQNMVLLDGIMIYQPFHILGFYSAFPTDIINQVDVYAGGHGSRFSGRISSVIDIASRSGNKRHYRGAVSLAPFVSTARIEGPIKENRVSFILSARQSVIEQGAARIIDRPLPFNFGDFFGKLDADVSQSSRLSVTGLRTHDRGTIGSEIEGTDPDEIGWTNNALGARYLVLPSVLPIMMDFTLSYSGQESTLGPRNEPTRTTAIRDLYMSMDITFFGSGSDWRTGMSGRFMNIANELGGLFQDTFFDGAIPTHIAFYLEPDIRIGSGLRVRPGLVMEGLSRKGFPLLEPRLRAVWQYGLHEISGAAGYYMQDVVGLTDRRDAASLFTVWSETLLRDQSVISADPSAQTVLSATHAILGYRVTPTHWLDFSVEGYHKWFDNLLIGEWTALPRFTTRQQSAYGTSAGFDSRIEVRASDFYGYISYGYSSTVYHAEQESLRLWYGEETLRFNPPHDRRHQLNALLSAGIFGFNMSASWQFGSGLPFNQALGFDGFVLVDDIIDVTESPSSRRVIYERPFNARLPAYHRLDISIERQMELRNANLTFQGSVINLYNRRNIFFLDVFTLRRVDQLPLIPTFGVKLEV